MFDRPSFPTVLLKIFVFSYGEDLGLLYPTLYSFIVGLRGFVGSFIVPPNPVIGRPLAALKTSSFEVGFVDTPSFERGCSLGYAVLPDPFYGLDLTI